ncbi:family 20 glycosylhydrolase [Paenibacillus planticolens]|uniref:beta-N-acetylhexosaminidase n=1 Tax=Paenibacillus planticolens TaxID=2654976 RepID=A0ABX1ZUN3_9BACL|nr:family 20 glycosylhydrolase [Paenibacillus planticolens]NOV03751.1 family 20 glycosylhydrolase [Paenibacillus planticolens]
MKKLIVKKVVSTAIALLLSVNIISAIPNVAKAAASQPSIFPKPVSYTVGTGQFLLTKTTSIYVAGNSAGETDELFKNGQVLANKLNTSTGYRISVIKSNNPTAGSIYLTTIGGNDAQGNEGYDLNTTSDQVKLTANKPEGVFRGIQTLMQLLPADIEKNKIVSGVQWVIPNSNISDKPTYEYRGLMLDVARHFFPVDVVKRQIDLASQYKINKFHMHLSDDQGWRIEIKSRPELIEYGSKGQVGGGPGGYYTQEQFKEIVNYAAERYIEVIPEIDMPGHTNAALASIAELNPDGKRKAMRTDTAVGYSTLMARSEITYQFVDDVVREIAAISPSPYFHLGGDESSATTASDYDYFIGRVTTILDKYGKKAVGWDPSDTSSGTTKDSILQDWNCTASTGTSAKAKGMKVIVSPANAYLDMKYYNNTALGLSWRGNVNTSKAYDLNPTACISGANIYGVESTLWSETVVTQDNIDYMLYPRLLANVEVGWTPQSNRNWDDFKGRLIDQTSRLQNKGIKFFADPVVWTPPFVPFHMEWKMDEGTGTTLGDTSGYKNGTLVGGATWATGKYGSGISLNGTSGYIDLATADIPGNWTVSVWVNGQPSTSRNEALLSGVTSSIKINQKKTGKVGFSIYGGKDYNYNYSIPNNQWTHLTFVGTSTETALYENGVLKETLPVKIDGPMDLVGAEASGASRNSFIKGSLDELNIFNRALSASEIAALIQSPTAPKTVLTAPQTATAGQSFEVTMGLSTVTQSEYQQVYAQDLKLNYDPANLILESVESVREGFQVVAQKSDVPGQSRILAASVAANNKGVLSQGDLLKFKFKVKSTAPTAYTTVSVGSASIANGQGNELQVADASRMISVISVPPVDKSFLNDLIAEAQGKHNAATEGTGSGQYPAGSKATLQAAIDKAKAVADNASATNQQVEQASADLNAALQAFLSSVVTYQPGDVNGDNKFTIGDLAIVAKYYGAKEGDANWNEAKIADVIGHGKVDIEDLAFVASKILGYE